MGLLVAGVVVFLGVHLVPTFPGLRARLQSRLGQNGYKGAFSVVSLLGLGLLIGGKSQASFVHVFSPPSWGRHATMALMLLACVSLAATYMKTSLTRFSAHPMLGATALWAAGHLLANGDLASLVLFGSFLAYAIGDMWSANRRGALPRGERQPWWRDALVVLVAVVIYAVLLWLHPHAFGVPVLRT